MAAGRRLATHPASVVAARRQSEKPAHLERDTSRSPDECKQYTTVAGCELAGCFPGTGTIYRQTSEQTGGAGGQSCEVVAKDAFVTCLETGEGGAIAVWRCEEDCEYCVEGGWQVPQSERFTSQVCDWYCW
jgi:hypothetical protein